MAKAKEDKKVSVEIRIADFRTGKEQELRSKFAKAGFNMAEDGQPGFMTTKVHGLHNMATGLGEEPNVAVNYSLGVVIFTQR